MKVIFRQRFVWQKRITVQNFYKIALFFQKIMHFQIVEITITSASPLKKFFKLQVSSFPPQTIAGHLFMTELS